MSKISADETPKTIENFNSTFNPKPIISKDTFSIQSVNRDPFLGTLTKKVHNVPTVKKLKSTQPVRPFPSVTYNARIKKADAKASLYIVTINNQQYKLKKGQLVDSVKLVSGSSDAILVSYKNQSKTIKRQ